MRVNVYAEELTDRVEIIEKEVNGTKFTGLRIYLYMPTTMGDGGPTSYDVAGPFLHRKMKGGGEVDDDSSAVTFWGKRDLRIVLQKALTVLDEYYKGRNNEER